MIISAPYKWKNMPLNKALIEQSIKEEKLPAKDEYIWSLQRKRDSLQRDIYILPI
jgi:hypothetical protein